MFNIGMSGYWFKMEFRTNGLNVKALLQQDAAGQQDGCSHHVVCKKNLYLRFILHGL